MKKHLLFFGLFFIVKLIYSQTTKADFDFVVVYHCQWAFVSLENKSTNADSVFWDMLGHGNYVYMNNPTPPIGNLDSDHDFTVSLVAKGQVQNDTITKSFNLRQTRARFDFKVQDSLKFAPLLVEFINNSQQTNGDILTYYWDFGDGNSSTLQNPVHIYSTPKTYYPKLTATTQSGCNLNYYAYIIVKDTIQRDEFDFITSGCNESTPPQCGYEKNYVIENETLKITGFYSGNCCTKKTAVLRNHGDTIFIKTFETGQECNCGCGYCFSINVPNIHKDSIIVSFDGNIAKAKLQTSISGIDNNCSFEVYPNPINNEFTLICNVLTNQSSIEIIDLFGKVVSNVTIPLSDNTVIPCNNLKSGIYILKVNIDNESYMTKRIIINNNR